MVERDSNELHQDFGIIAICHNCGRPIVLVQVKQKRKRSVRITQLGLSDSFIDENAACPKCGTCPENWQTKDLESLMDTWNVGDFFQYHYWRDLTSREKQKIVKEGTGTVRKGELVAPMMTRGALRSKHPIIQTGEIEVYTYCRNKKCAVWLEGLAVIKRGKFAGITSIRSRKMVTTKSANQNRRGSDPARSSWGSKEGKMIAHKKVIGR